LNDEIEFKERILINFYLILFNWDENGLSGLSIGSNSTLQSILFFPSKEKIYE
jgi:hypothetical protein